MVDCDYSAQDYAEGLCLPQEHDGTDGEIPEYELLEYVRGLAPTADDIRKLRAEGFLQVTDTKWIRKL